MPKDYYQNTLYPIQDKVLDVVANLPVDFYLTGGTALSRAYLHHRYSDDLDFFVNDHPDFKLQVNNVFQTLKRNFRSVEAMVADDAFARFLVYDQGASLKLDFVNDVSYRKGSYVETPIFSRTDNLSNILSNKLTALGRYTAKDVVDIVYICHHLFYNWEEVVNDACEKDLWVNPVQIAEVLEQFPTAKLNEIIWIDKAPTPEWFTTQIGIIIPDILRGQENSIFQG